MYFSFGAGSGGLTNGNNKPQRSGESPLPRHLLQPRGLHSGGSSAPHSCISEPRHSGIPTIPIVLRSFWEVTGVRDISSDMFSLFSFITSPSPTSICVCVPLLSPGVAIAPAVDFPDIFSSRKWFQDKGNTIILEMS